MPLMGRSRLEFCKNLLNGGLTPSPKFLEYLLNYSYITIQVLIRPRWGNFIYSASKEQKKLTQIEMIKVTGAKVIVIGLINDMMTQFASPKSYKKRLKMAYPLDLTFRQAFENVV